jgi:hypothetical protein
MKSEITYPLNDIQNIVYHFLSDNREIITGNRETIPTFEQFYTASDLITRLIINRFPFLADFSNGNPETHDIIQPFLYRLITFPLPASALFPD